MDSFHAWLAGGFQLHITCCTWNDKFFFCSNLAGKKILHVAPIFIFSCILLVFLLHSEGGFAMKVGLLCYVLKTASCCDSRKSLVTLCCHVAKNYHINDILSSCHLMIAKQLMLDWWWMCIKNVALEIMTQFLQVFLHEGLFTSWTTKLSHVIGFLFMVTLNGPISKKNCTLKAFGPLTRCKPGMNKEKWPCTKKCMCWIFLIYVQKGQFWDFSVFMFDFFSPSSSILSS